MSDTGEEGHFTDNITETIQDWISSDSANALVQGDSSSTLKQFPDNSVDCVMTSPPYWGVRNYEGGSELGVEESHQEFIDNRLGTFAELQRVLKPEGSFWLNIGGTYDDKDFQGVPWRLALALKDRQDWVLRNDIIWHNVKVNPTSATDRLRVMHEYIFYFTHQREYDDDAVREDEDFELEFNENGAVVSPTGVFRTRYRRQITNNDHLSDAEREAALRTRSPPGETEKQGDRGFPDGHQRRTANNPRRL